MTIDNMLIELTTFLENNAIILVSGLYLMWILYDIRTRFKATAKRTKLNLELSKVKETHKVDRDKIAELGKKITNLTYKPNICFRTYEGTIARNVSTKTTVDEAGDLVAVVHTIRKKNVGGKFDNIVVYPTLFESIDAREKLIK